MAKPANNDAPPADAQIAATSTSHQPGDGDPTQTPPAPSTDAQPGDAPRTDGPTSDESSTQNPPSTSADGVDLGRFEEYEEYRAQGGAMDQKKWLKEYYPE